MKASQAATDLTAHFKAMRDALDPGLPPASSMVFSDLVKEQADLFAKVWGETATVGEQSRLAEINDVLSTYGEAKR